MNDRELTQLQQHGALTLMPSSTLAEVMEGIDTLGLNPRDVMLTVDYGLVRLLVTGPKEKYCDDCDGEGEIIIDSLAPHGHLQCTKDCPTCSGTGIVEEGTNGS